MSGIKFAQHGEHSLVIGDDGPEGLKDADLRVQKNVYQARRLAQVARLLLVLYGFQLFKVLVHLVFI